MTPARARVGNLASGLPDSETPAVETVEVVAKWIGTALQSLAYSGHSRARVEEADPEAVREAVPVVDSVVDSVLVPVVDLRTLRSPDSRLVI